MKQVTCTAMQYESEPQTLTRPRGKALGLPDPWCCAVTATDLFLFLKQKTNLILSIHAVCKEYTTCDPTTQYESQAATSTR